MNLFDLLFSKPQSWGVLALQTGAAVFLLGTWILLDPDRSNVALVLFIMVLLRSVSSVLALTVANYVQNREDKT